MQSIFGKTRTARYYAGGDGFLGRLARDTRGNMLALMAAALIPFCGLVGGGIDLSRMYITKTRLQHACDAGALAGRKKMGSGTWSATDANTAAAQYFDANFASGSYGSTGLTKTFAEAAGKVTGTASATLPMTLMRVLGKTTETLTVTCDAEMRLPNTDIMFVLDTTGSMACDPDGTNCNGGTTSKIAGLRVAVKCFYEIVARLDTDATCTTGTPSGGTGNQVQIRFGFMPYSTNVNVGKLLPTSFLADSWKYQSRVGRWWVLTKTKTKVKNVSEPNVPQSYCNDAAAEAAGYNSYSETFSGSTTSPPYPNGTKRSTKRVVTNTTSWNNNTCYGTETTTDNDYELREAVTPTASDEFADWHYGQITTNVSGLKNGTGWNASLPLLIENNGTTRNVAWDGCIEERPTVRQTTYSPVPSGAYDLNIDLPPTAGDPNSLWGPALRNVTYGRNIENAYSQASRADVYTATNYWIPNQYYCPTEAKKLQSWTDAASFDTYVNSLTPTGNTYHDIGMLWGARFMSPTGIFASENAFTPQGGEIDRNMIFMTDGDASSAACDYTAYGLAWWDQRTTTDVGNANVCSLAQTALNDQVNARMDALCTAVKNKNITLWVISFGSGSNTATETRLSNCATTGRYFAARDSATLQATFQSIANQISQLRLTR